jgi:transcriptional regulator of met regulon
MSRDDFFVFFEAFTARRTGLSVSSDPSKFELKPPATATSTMDPNQMAEAKRRHQVYLMLRHLDSRRNQVEADLLQALAGQEVPHDKSLSQLRDKLDDIQALRRSYEAELMVSNKTEQYVVPDSVFVSSTSTDLPQYRQAVQARD